MGGPLAAGPAGYCMCPQCGTMSIHATGAPCYDATCPKCGTKMTRALDVPAQAVTEMVSRSREARQALAMLARAAEQMAWEGPNGDEDRLTMLERGMQGIEAAIAATGARAKVISGMDRLEWLRKWAPLGVLSFIMLRLLSGRSKLL